MTSSSGRRPRTVTWTRGQLPVIPSRPLPDGPRPTPAQVAARLQKAYRGWLIIWSPWRQTYTAFAACTRDPLVIDEAAVSRLLDRISEVEIVAAIHAPTGVSGG